MIGTPCPTAAQMAEMRAERTPGDADGPMAERTAAQYACRWWVLGLVGLAQLMVALDVTVVNVALPSAQHALGFSIGLRQWVITAYALAFGSLLLLGGRIGDLFGRKWTFVGGVLGFAAASAVGGAAQSFGMLVAARAAQGVCGAVLAPSALALLTTTFTDGAERSRAFAVFTSIVSSGAAVGLLLGGVLTQLLSWRYSLFVNLGFALPVAAGGLRLLVNEAPTERPALDLPGVASGSLGLFSLVYGVSNAETHSWGATLTIAPLCAAAALLSGFVVIESRVRNPLLPLRIVRDRARGGSYLAIAVTAMAVFAVFLFLTFYLQSTLGFTPIDTGLAFLPMTLAITLSAAIVNARLLGRLGPRPLMTIGALLGAGGMAWLAQLTATSSYAGHVAPALVAVGVAVGTVFSSAISTATHRVESRDAGVASAMVNTMQQVSGAIGGALLSTIFMSALRSYADGRPESPRGLGLAAVHGYTTAFWVAAAIFAGGALLLGLMVPSIKEHTTAGRSAPLDGAEADVARVART